MALRGAARNVLTVLQVDVETLAPRTQSNQKVYGTSPKVKGRWYCGLRT